MNVLPALRDLVCGLSIYGDVVPDRLTQVDRNDLVVGRFYYQCSRNPDILEEEEKWAVVEIKEGRYPDYVYYQICMVVLILPTPKWYSMIGPDWWGKDVNITFNCCKSQILNLTDDMPADSGVYYKYFVPTGA